MPTINKMMGIGSYRLHRGLRRAAGRMALAVHAVFLRDADAAAAWIDAARQPASERLFPLRQGDDADRPRNAETPWRSGSPTARRYEADFVILGTGFNIDPWPAPSSATPPATSCSGRTSIRRRPGSSPTILGNFPYLNGDFTFREKTPGRAPWLKQRVLLQLRGFRIHGKGQRRHPRRLGRAAWLARAIAANALCRGCKGALAGHAGLRQAGTGCLSGELFAMTTAACRIAVSRKSTRREPPCCCAQR
jgi:hypothetical protein